jgi:hypothetical protein
VTERLSNLEVENASSFKDEAEGFEKSLFSKVARPERREECISILRLISEGNLRPARGYLKSKNAYAFFSSPRVDKQKNLICSVEEHDGSSPASGLTTLSILHPALPPGNLSGSSEPRR